MSHNYFLMNLMSHNIYYVKLNTGIFKGVDIVKSLIVNMLPVAYKLPVNNLLIIYLIIPIIQKIRSLS